MTDAQLQVFLTRDHVLEQILDDLALDLSALGIRVIRGPESRPGEKTLYPPEDWPRLFGKTDVAVFTSRGIASAELMRASPRLRGIVNVAIGLETVDLKAADELGIIVGHGAVPENYLGMAEAAVMLILNLRYQLRATEQVLRGQRQRPPARPEAQHARMLYRSTVGMLGFGRIAGAVANRLRPFGVTMISHSPTTRPDRFPEDVTQVDFDTLMRKSDIVAIFAESNSNTRGMIGKRALSLMKPTAYLLNVARGDLLDEAAVERALRERRIAGAALDVSQVEPLPMDSPLRTLDNAILTPHMVGHTLELYEALAPAALENITRILRGDLPLYCKNPHIEQKWRERLALLA